MAAGLLAVANIFDRENVSRYLLMSDEALACEQADDLIRD